VGGWVNLWAFKEEREMAKPLLKEELWSRIESLFPVKESNPKGGRPRIPDRAVLTGILFVLRTGCPWEYLPQELGCGSGMTCWRRLRDWHAAGLWEQIWRLLLDELGLADEIDWDKAIFDSCSVRAVFGGRRPARIPPIAAKMARSGMLCAMAKGPRWRSSIPARTSTTANKRFR
jgi:transposase